MHKRPLSGAASRCWEMKMGTRRLQPPPRCPVRGPEGPGASRGATGAAAPHRFMWGTRCLQYPTAIHKPQPLNEKLTPQHRLGGGFAVHPSVQRGEQENLEETRAHRLLSKPPA